MQVQIKEAMNEANELIIEAGIRFSEMKKAGLRILSELSF